MTLEEYMALPWKTTVERSGLLDGTPCFVAENTELGAIGQGDTPEAALADLETARREMLTVLIDKGVEIPVPPPLPYPTARVTTDGGATWTDCHIVETVTVGLSNSIEIDARDLEASRLAMDEFVASGSDGISSEDLFAELGLDDAATTNLVDVSSKLVVATEDAAGGDREVG